MICINTNIWKTLKQPIYVGDKTIQEVYANNKRVYPEIYAQPSISGVKIGDSFYFAPTCIYLPSATFNSVTTGYSETLNIDSLQVIKTEERTEDNKTICNGVFLVGEGIEPICSNVSISYSEGPKDGAHTLECFYVNDDNTISGLKADFTFNIPYNGSYYTGLLKPVINRYLVAHGWVASGYEKLLPPWICSNGQGTGTVKNITNNTTAATALTEAVQISKDLFCQGIKIPDGAKILRISVNSNYREPNAAGLAGFGPTGSTPTIRGDTKGYSAGCYYGQLSENSALEYVPCINAVTYTNGLRVPLYIGTQEGFCGSIFTIDKDTGDISLTTKACSNGTRRTYTGASLYDGSTKVGELFYTVDNVITELKTEENFLWYKGTYTGA